MKILSIIKNLFQKLFRKKQPPKPNLKMSRYEANNIGVNLRADIEKLNCKIVRLKQIISRENCESAKHRDVSNLIGSMSHLQNLINKCKENELSIITVSHFKVLVETYTVDGLITDIENHIKEN